MFKLSYLLDYEVQEVSQIFGIFELDFVFFDSIKQVYKSFVFGFQFYLHLGRPVSMPKYGNNRSKLLHFGKRLINRRPKLILSLFYLIQGGHMLNS